MGSGVFDGDLDSPLGVGPRHHSAPQGGVDGGVPLVLGCGLVLLEAGRQLIGVLRISWTDRGITSPQELLACPHGGHDDRSTHAVYDTDLEDDGRMVGAEHHRESFIQLESRIGFW